MVELLVFGWRIWLSCWVNLCFDFDFESRMLMLVLGMFMFLLSMLVVMMVL